MPYFKTEPDVFYLRLLDDYIIDCITYQPQSHLYTKYVGEIPPHIYSRCYQLIDGEIVRDEEKFKVYLKTLKDSIE